jgi:ATP-dependent DNA helicase RecG
VGEGEETEFKRGLGDFSAIGRAVCAFANTEGGVIILGVTDSQSIIGVNEDADEVQERLETFLRTGCSAPVNGQCGRHEDPNGWVHWIEISHQDQPEPLRYEGRVWVRRECSSVEPSPSELQELYNTSDKPSSGSIE